MALTKFSDLPIRSNGSKIEASWFNSIRTLLTQIFGDIQGESSQPIGQTDTNQTVTEIANVDKLEFSMIDVEYMVRRNTDTVEVMQSGKFSIQYLRVANSWRIVGDQQDINGDDGQIEFSLLEDTGGGSNLVTLRYSTTTISGATHVGDLKVRAKKWIA